MTFDVTFNILYTPCKFEKTLKTITDREKYNNQLSNT